MNDTLLKIASVLRAGPFSWIALGVTVFALAAACNPDVETASTPTSTNTTSGAGGSSTTSGTGGKISSVPKPPKLGAQIDRLGRPAINTALNQALAPKNKHKNAEDKWNQNHDPTTWSNLFGSDVASNLAFYDGLDGSCGNQALSCNDASNNCYIPLANLLTKDWLIVKGNASEECTHYLAIEANAHNIFDNDQCGGRTPNMDVIETTYSLIINGSMAGIDDGIPSTSQGTEQTFPYLEAPHN